ncbi:thioredoxin domain-containing protein [uncultured Bacteroides sp.]|uniref:thioredoxin domain-containing protein n=1 Tax=uncultured Bacteroides sp. TaxID=162156 RepID=UPI0025CD7082|nr:thioredoxin domain-containing protein [uncultured Bacteroides sp.]
MKLSSLLILLILLSACSCRNDEVIAEVNGRKIYNSELSQVTKQEIFDFLNRTYEIKMRSLDDLVKRKLIEYEASKQNLSVDDFLNIYVCRAMQDSAMAGVADMPAKKLRGRLIQRLVDSLFYEAQITRYIYPPKMPSCVITDLNIRYRGNLDAKTYLIVASDFDCQRCGEFEKTLKRIYNEYKSKVKFGFVNFADEPTFASLACEAADKYGKFWEFHDALFSYAAPLDSVYVYGLAKNMGMDVAAYKQDILSAETYNSVNRTINKLMERGLFATPTIIINNRLVYITNSYEELTRLLNQELQNE